MPLYEPQQQATRGNEQSESYEQLTLLCYA